MRLNTGPYSLTDKFHYGIVYSPVRTLILFVLSALLHFFIFYKFAVYKPSKKIIEKLENVVQVKINEPTTTKKIVEVPLEETHPPEAYSYKGAQNHKALKEMKAKQNPSPHKGLNPGEMTVHNKNQPNPYSKNTDKAELRHNVTKNKSEGYTKLLPSPEELAHQLKVGYQDYLDEEIEEGDRIDLNTTDYRYIGYFTSLRKAFELVWSYPSQAVRLGLEGVVRIDFAISKDGSLKYAKITSTSGHEILDLAAVEALKAASPYAPLPSELNKEHLVISGSFRYVLGSY